MGRKKPSETNRILDEKYSQRLPHGYYRIVCKETGKEFFNSGKNSTALTNHLRKIKPDVQIPNNYVRRKYYFEHGKVWDEIYFDFYPHDKPETVQCKLCDWATEDLENKSGAYTNHVKNKHELSVGEYVKQFPDEIKYFNKHKLEIERIKHLDDVDNFIICLECGEKFRALSNTHMKNKHNMTLTEYKLKHNVEKVTSKYNQRINYSNWERNYKYYPFIKYSKQEEELFQFITLDLNIPVKRGDRKMLNGKELDILIPSHKLAIEFNGNLWHSEIYGKKNKNYHLNKTLDVNEKGYNLIQIFEDEWFNNEELIKEKIKHILGKNDGVRVGARKCTIKEMDNKLANLFLDKFHIQGAAKWSESIILGAYYNDRLIGVMGFNGKRNMNQGKKEYDFELVRFATNFHYIISGLGGKMFNFFIKKYKPKSVVSFADRRWSFNNTNLYEKIGFHKDGFTSPTYTYYKPTIDKYKRYSKFQFGLKGLKDKGLFIEGLSEWECMQHHGWDRIWDCGLIRYVWTYE